MKNYYFNPHTYSETYVVLAESKEIALEKLKLHLEAKIANSPSHSMDFTKQYYSKWITATVDSLPKGYTIDVYETGQVIEGEVS